MIRRGPNSWRSAFWIAVCLSILALVSMSMPSDAQVEKAPVAHINVLVVNPRSGQPVSNVWITAAIWNGSADENKVVTFSAQTDATGKASFAMPLLQHISFVTAPPDDFEVCPELEFTTVQVVQPGTIGAYDSTCGKLKWFGHPSPGEAVIFVRPLNVWQRMLKEIP